MVYPTLFRHLSADAKHKPYMHSKIIYMMQRDQSGYFGWLFDVACYSESLPNHITAPPG